MQKRLNLVMKVDDIRQDAAGRQPRMRFGERSPSFIDVADRLIRGVAGNDPCGQADRILLGRDQSLTCCPLRGRRTEQRSRVRPNARQYNSAYKSPGWFWPAS